MIVLVNLKDGVSPRDYEDWVQNSYAPAVKNLPSISNWRNHRVNGVLGSDAAPPYAYVVTLEVNNMEELGRDMAGREMRRLLPELHEYAEVTQLVAERFV
jgi:hypothetical protein